MSWDLAAIALAAYLLGSIPSAILAARWLKGIDIREHGSGNAGASNTLRVLGWPAAIAVGLFDVGKGSLAVLFVSRLSLIGAPADPLAAQLVSAAAAVCGHIWTAFAGLRGGKGVATSAGAMLALAPGTTALCLPVFVAVAALTRYAALASLSGTACFPLLLWGLRAAKLSDAPDALIAFAWGLFALTLFTHRANVGRLLAGTENRFGKN